MKYDATIPFRIPQRINQRSDVRAFFKELLTAGINFHPDTRAHEYTPVLPKRYDVSMNKCFIVGERHDFDVYSVAADVWADWHAKGANDGHDNAD